MQRVEPRTDEVDGVGQKMACGVGNMDSFSGDGHDSFNSNNGYHGSLFETPQSILSSPQYDMFKSPFRSHRCSLCQKDVKGQHRQFSCSHKVCGHCCSFTDSRKCIICYTNAGSNPFSPYMFLSPPQNEQPHEFLDTSVSLHNRSIASYQNGLTDTLHNMSLGLADISGGLDSFNLWDNRSKFSTPSKNSLSQGIISPDSAIRQEDDHPPVFSPNSQHPTTPVITSPLSTVTHSKTTSQRSMLPTCATCGESARAEAFCANCRELLCAVCIIAHQRVRITRDHVVVTLQQLLCHMTASTFGSGDDGIVGGSTDSSPRASSVCSTHDGKVFCSCETCGRIPLCAHCISLHSTHHIIPLGDVRVCVVSLLAESRRNERSIEEAIESVRAMSERVDASVQAAASELRSLMHLHMSALEERKRELLQRVDTIRQSKTKNLKAQAENLAVAKAKFAQTIKSVECATAEEDNSQLSSAFQELMQLYAQPIHLIPHENDAIKFNVPENQLLSQIRALGELESGPCARLCHLVGEGYKRPIRERQCMAYVQLRDACGEVVPIGHSDGGIFDVTATVIAPDGRSLEVHIGRSETEPGVIGVAYFPVLNGQHQLDIRVRGLSISGCPTTVEVRHGRNYADIATQGELFSFGKEGSGDGELCRPWGICVDLRGRVLVADRSNNRIQIFDRDGIFLSKFGSGGTRSGQFDRPAGVTVNTRNNIVVADKDNHRIQVFDENGNFLLKFGERGRPIGMFNYPWGVATNSHNHIAVSDTRNHRVQVFNENGQFIRKCGFDTAFFYKHLDSPRGVCYLSDGQLLITDFNNHRLAVLSSRDTPEMKVYGSEGSAEGMFCRPQGVKVDPEGHILICDSRNNRIQVFSGDDMRCIAVFGQSSTSSGFEMPAELPAPFRSVGPTPFHATNTQTSVSSLDLSSSGPRPLLDRPTDIAIAPDGRIYVVDFGNNCVRVF
ncbi:b-box zinc finger [Dictyocaulus viviparus]|uniref:B-box zinc finger n=1 Tax=Dictyocaulus viviparus TaxID=29172 RepID=A0A0D8YBT9_DICVI|nr:b-box zinc finger [Dictyocaulus viviparus]